MNREDKYDLVNKAESLKELADVIRSFADDEGLIMGRTRQFEAGKMAYFCENYKGKVHNTLTREFGIRQQAMMLYFYDSFEDKIREEFKAIIEDYKEKAEAIRRITGEGKDN